MTPYLHQEQMADTIEASPNWGFWHDTGTGKTIGVLLGLDRVKPFPCLVLAPKHVVTHAWLEDSKHFPDIRVVAAVGSKKRRERAYLAVHSGEADVLVTNYEAARTRQDRAAVEHIQWEAVVCDESTKIKSASGQTSRLLRRLARRLPGASRYCLSGYPAPNDRSDLWAQMDFIKPGFLGGSFHGFRSKYFYQPRSELSWLWTPKLGSEEEIDEEVGKLSSWLRKEDCLELPPKIDEFHEVELKRPERKAYNDFISDWVLEFQEGDVQATNAFVQLMKCRQMTAGIVRRTDGEWEELGKSKLSVVQELVEDDPSPVIIVGQYRRELERLHDLWPENSYLLYGGLSTREADEAITGFQQGKRKTLLCHPAAMGHGLTFTNCSRMIFASLDYSFELYAQVKDRIHRIGQEKSCVYHHLLAKDTVDQAILNALRGKQTLTLDMIDFARRTSRPGSVTG